MIKLVALLKRRQGMSSEEFMTYYDSHHAKLTEKTLAGNVVRYFRRYINPLAHPLWGEFTIEERESHFRGDLSAGGEPAH